jgi:hypothetical protein
MFGNPRFANPARSNWQWLGTDSADLKNALFPLGLPALGQPRRSDEGSGISGLPLIAAESSTAVSGTLGHKQPWWPYHGGPLSAGRGPGVTFNDALPTSDGQPSRTHSLGGEPHSQRKGPTGAAGEFLVVAAGGTSVFNRGGGTNGRDHSASTRNGRRAYRSRKCA